MPRILVVDDHDILRHGVRDILQAQDAWEVIGEASNGEEAVLLTRELKPDAVVMDISMPVMNGIDATKEIVKANPTCKVLILTMHEDGNLWKSIKRSGAKGLVTKSNALDQLTPALKTIIEGSTYFPDSTIYP